MVINLNGASAKSAVALVTAVLAVVLMIMSAPARALQGADGVHDPASIVKYNGVYHSWGTGNQITHMTSTDLVNWTSASTVFATGTWPSWINTYVSDFAGNFWAPQCVYMNSKYYLYYCCSDFGTKVSCIGVATSTDLSTWTDQGLVLSSGSSTTYNAIDPSAFQDASGNWWLTWGSHWTGIWAAQIDPTTGKLLNSTKTNIVNVSDAEASYVVYRSPYYYVFYNRGVCCNGTSSTYYICTARATSPTGSYTGNKTFLSGSNPVYGPGQFGQYIEGSTRYLTYHYYDGNSNGYPRLKVQQLNYTGGWMVPGDWLASGTYKIVNSANGLALSGGTGASLQPVTINTYTGATNQQWVITSLGWGLYEVTCASGGLSLDAYGCSNTNGTLLDLYSYWGGTCQQWLIDRASDGSYVIQTYNGGTSGMDVVDDPNGSTTSGTQLQLYAYLGGTPQKWTISAP